MIIFINRNVILLVIIKINKREIVKNFKNISRIKRLKFCSNHSHSIKNIKREIDKLLSLANYINIERKEKIHF